MTTEKKELQATNEALDAIANWMKSGTNEGISFEISALPMISLQIHFWAAATPRDSHLLVTAGNL